MSVTYVPATVSLSVTYICCDNFLGPNVLPGVCLFVCLSVVKLLIGS